MVLRKTKPKAPSENGVTRTRTRTSGVQNMAKKGNEQFDHWSFLDQIEAPMWVDLILECNSAYQDMDDEWFYISHPIHQSSSQQLKSAFSRAEESGISMEFGIQGSYSPKLPLSVSRSRGKDFRSRQWGQGNRRLTFDKKHPVKDLSSKSSGTGLRADKEIKHKTSYKKVTVSTASNSNFACQRPVLRSGDKKNCSNSSAVDSDESCSRSCITSENCEQHVKSSAVSSSSSTITSEASERTQQKSMEVSGQVLGHSSGILSALRVSLRKSCVTRQASRVEANVCRKSEGPKSSSSKSSVGSSSNPPYRERGNLSESGSKDKTPDSRNISRMPQAPIVEMRKTNMYKGPVKAQGKTSMPKLVNGRSVSSSMGNGSTKAKVLYPNVQRKALIPHRANECVSSTVVSKASERIGGSQCRRTVGSGKENVVGRTGLTQKSSLKDDQIRDGVQISLVTKRRTKKK